LDWAPAIGRSRVSGLAAVTGGGSPSPAPGNVLARFLWWTLKISQGASSLQDGAVYGYVAGRNATERQIVDHLVALPQNVPQLPTADGLYILAGGYSGSTLNLSWLEAGQPIPSGYTTGVALVEAQATIPDTQLAVIKNPSSSSPRAAAVHRTMPRKRWWQS